MVDRLEDLSAAGVSIWLDDLSRKLLATGRLKGLVDHSHVVGITSNPTIFANAIGGSADYDDQIRELAQRGTSTAEALRLLTVADVRSACDVLRPVYEATDSIDGRVSIEVDPRLAHDTADAITEARQLWQLVDRPNLFIKIPATEAGLPAITQCLAEGISVNVTLIFSLQRYAAVIDAFLDGMEARPHRQPRPVHPDVCGLVLRQQSGRRDRQPTGHDRHPAGAGAERESRDRQRQTCVRALRIGLLR